MIPVLPHHLRPPPSTWHGLNDSSNITEHQKTRISAEAVSASASSLPPTKTPPSSSPSRASTMPGIYGRGEPEGPRSSRGGVKAPRRSMLSVLLNEQENPQHQHDGTSQSMTDNNDSHHDESASKQNNALPPPPQGEENPLVYQRSPPPIIQLPQDPPVLTRTVLSAVDMQQQRQVIENELTERFQQVKRGQQQQQQQQSSTMIEDSSSSHGANTAAGYRARGSQSSNEARKSRRAQHHRAIIHDLTEIVTDLFLAESKLVNPSLYGVVQPNQTTEREQVSRNVQDFILSLPPRYALGAETPSEVLIHMRLMAAVRADPTRPSVHIANLDQDDHWRNVVNVNVNVDGGSQHGNRNSNNPKRLVTLCCRDEHGLLEYISKMLASGGSRVLDADVMLSTDNIVLDRFVVEMNGRLRLDKLAQYVGDFLEQAKNSKNDEDREECPSANAAAVSEFATLSSPLYFHKETVVPPRRCTSSMDLVRGVPLKQALKENDGDPQNLLASAATREGFLPLTRSHTMFNPRPSSSTVKSVPSDKGNKMNDPNTLSKPRNASTGHLEPASLKEQPDFSNTPQDRPLVNRQGHSDLDVVIGKNNKQLDEADDNVLKKREVPLIPFDELMLIDTLGVGRVSTIYSAAWRPKSSSQGHEAADKDIRMLALKVAIVTQESQNFSHIVELQREFEIAASLQHPNISHLVGIAEDHDCFCLAYEYYEGGSLLSLVSDRRRRYEYLPIALDIVQGMAYLHSRNVIHRDLKLSNILLDRSNRAKISDFGMSVAMTGQELTAETGTYRYMAPEVIRHESYSSNADVYSFAICLWQLITREVPFASMTPIQAAFRVAQGERPTIPDSTPARLKEIIIACWDHDSHKRPSFTWVAMALYDYATSAFSPATVSTQTLQIANEMLANVEGNSTVNVDSSIAPLSMSGPTSREKDHNDDDGNIGLEI